MIGINSYKDLCREIEILELRVKSIELEIKQFRKLMIQRPKDRMERLEDTLFVLKEILEEKIKYKEKIENVLKEFDGIQYKVMYLKLKENMTAEKIAEKLWYSERHIRRILKQCKKSTW